MDLASGEPPQYLSSQTQPAERFDVLRSDLNWVRKFEDGSKLDAKLGFNASRRHTDFRQQGYDAAQLQTLDAVTLSSANDRGFTSVGKYSTPLKAEHTLVGWKLALATAAKTGWSTTARFQGTSRSTATSATPPRCAGSRCTPRTNGP